MKPIIEESESATLSECLRDITPQIAASWLLHTGLPCAASRLPCVAKPMWRPNFSAR